MTENQNNQPRGIRNNNPGNIRHGANWIGLEPNSKELDKSFCVFKSPVYGIRALAKVLLNYQRLYKINTIRGIINRYAPPNENNTDSYINAVANQLGIGADDLIDIKEPCILVVLIKAIIRHENGVQPYDTQTILEGIEIA
ncbi:MAG: structural protein [Alphaproteobacteria bacterium]